MLWNVYRKSEKESNWDYISVKVMVF